MAEGGVMQNIKSMQDQMDLFDYDGMKDDGMLRDPVSGNEVPPGSMAKEVRDDIPTMLSEGEYVVPADVLRYYGVSFFENLRNQAKNNLQQMERTGRIGGEPITPEQAQRNMQIKPVGMPKPATANQGGVMTGFQSGGDNSAFSPQNLPQGRNPIEYFSPFSTMSSSAEINEAIKNSTETVQVTQFRKHYDATGKSIEIKYVSDSNNPGQFIIDTSDPQNVENAAAYPLTEEGYAALKPEFETQKKDRREFVPDKKPDTSFLEGISANDAEGLKNKAGELLDLKNIPGLIRPGGLGPPGLQLLGGVSSINRLAQAKGIMQFAKEQGDAGVKGMSELAGEIQTLINNSAFDTGFFKTLDSLGIGTGNSYKEIIKNYYSGKYDEVLPNARYDSAGKNVGQRREYTFNTDTSEGMYNLHEAMQGTYGSRMRYLASQQIHSQSLAKKGFDDVSYYGSSTSITDPDFFSAVPKTAVSDEPPKDKDDDREPITISSKSDNDNEESKSSAGTPSGGGSPGSGGGSPGSGSGSPVTTYGGYSGGPGRAKGGLMMATKKKKRGRPRKSGLAGKQ